MRMKKICDDNQADKHKPIAGLRTVLVLLSVMVLFIPFNDNRVYAWDYRDYLKPEPERLEQQPVWERSPMIDLLDLKEVDIRDVLKLLSQKSGLNIIADEQVHGKVTVYLRDMQTLDALKIIAEAYGWAYLKDKEVIKLITQQAFAQKFGYPFGQSAETRTVKLIYADVGDVTRVLNQMKSDFGKVISDEKSQTVILQDNPQTVEQMAGMIARMDQATETKVFCLNYALAEDLAPKVQKVLSASSGSMKFDARSNTLVVSDTPAHLAKAQKIISAFDQKDAGILIEARILQIALTDEHKLGINWQALISDFHAMSLRGNFDILGPNEKRGTFGIGTLSDDDYTVLIEALDEMGSTDILSSPRITTVNNHEAKILVGMTEPYVTTTTTTPESGPPTTAETVNFIEVGVKLNVTPRIHNDGFITLKIRPEVSSVVDSLTTSNNNIIPVVETSEAETTVIVKDGVTVVIGGLIKQEKVHAHKKVPVFGDLPVMGNVFKNQRDYVKKTEIVIFMTPRILDADSYGNVK